MRPERSGALGVDLAGPDDDVECAVPAGTRAGAVAGVRLTRRPVGPAKIVQRDGIPGTAPCGPHWTSPGSGRDCRRIRAVADVADGLAESPQESRLRLVLRDSDLPRPIAQYSVRAGSIFLARTDFAWPEHKLALEYEGRWHGERQQVAPDRRRLNRLTSAGWRVLFVTAEDLREPARLLVRIRAALANSPGSA